MKQNKKPVGRPKKDGSNINCKLTQETYDGLSKFCGETGLPKTAAVENAVKMYLEHYKKTKQI